ncbi:MAG: NAD(P)H-dependent flavin oxidoreductase [Candidatus Sericytochromatia bacterium]
MTRLLGIERPIVLGPFGGGLSSVELAGIVSNAGGLGSFGAHHLNPDGIHEVVTALRAETTKPFSVNLWVPLGTEPSPAEAADAFAAAREALAPYYAALGLTPPALPERFGTPFEDQVEALLDAAPPVFSFIYGVPSPAVLAECRRRGIVTLGTATHVAEAVALEAAGVDVVVASGSEAGGHRASFLGTPETSPAASALVPQVVDAVSCPVIAAGGIADGRGVAAALALGAEAVQVGTAFLACVESGTSDAHRAALTSEAARATVLTRVFSGRLARGIPNALRDGLEPLAQSIPPYPVQNWLTSSIRREAARQGRAEMLGLWAGQNAPLVRHRHARAFFDFLVADTEAQLARLAGLSAGRIER